MLKSGGFKAITSSSTQICGHAAVFTSGMKTDSYQISFVSLCQTVNQKIGMDTTYRYAREFVVNVLMPNARMRLVKKLGETLQVSFSTELFNSTARSSCASGY